MFTVFRIPAAKVANEVWAGVSHGQRVRELAAWVNTRILRQVVSLQRIRMFGRTLILVSAHR